MGRYIAVEITKTLPPKQVRSVCRVPHTQGFLHLQVKFESKIGILIILFSVKIRIGEKSNHLNLEENEICSRQARKFAPFVEISHVRKT